MTFKKKKIKSIYGRYLFRDEKEVNLGNDEQNTSEEKAATTSSGDTIINVQNVERCGDPNAS